MAKKEKLSTDGGQALNADNPFGGLSAAGLPQAQPAPAPVSKPVPAPAAPKKRGRVDIKRVKAGRGGKTVTLCAGEGLLHTGPQELDSLVKTLKTRCGTGGAVKGKTIEIQGDQREAVAAELEQRGYRVVFAGG
ncbi:translation initiation factor [Ruficoccus amylovorans]|uniref:Translation initiation factor n=1 Tax=Ruficoccus amylovorans TaxID=1804625 RepID=A0A842HAD2_9BACT|nr:translation initiation factor [Ruficoccus amylovorans]MBC2593089.1 translation initiation factor [Ruficoccus amylovorans]